MGWFCQFKVLTFTLASQPQTTDASSEFRELQDLFSVSFLVN